MSTPLQALHSLHELAWVDEKTKLIFDFMQKKVHRMYTNSKTIWTLEQINFIYLPNDITREKCHQALLNLLGQIFSGIPSLKVCMELVETFLL